MLKTVLSCVALVALVAGCQTNKKETVPMGSSSLTDVSPNPTPVDRTPTVTPVSTYDQPVSDGPVTSITPTGGSKKYTVKKGDTLWSIATRSYGDGKQYTKIVSANPGVSPQTLKVGQQIVIP